MYASLVQFSRVALHVIRHGLITGPLYIDIRVHTDEAIPSEFLIIKGSTFKSVNRSHGDNLNGEKGEAGLI